MQVKINQSSEGNIGKLIQSLGSDKVEERKTARVGLIQIGKPAVPALVLLLADTRLRLRWEASFILGEIHDPAAAPGLVKALMDDAFEVRWRAAEALVHLEREALIPLFEGLHDHFESVLMRQGAYHILRALSAQGHLSDPSIKVLEALESIEPAITVPWAVERALEAHALSKPKPRKDPNVIDQDFIIKYMLDNPQGDED